MLELGDVVRDHPGTPPACGDQLQGFEGVVEEPVTLCVDDASSQRILDLLGADADAERAQGFSGAGSDGFPPQLRIVQVLVAQLGSVPRHPGSESCVDVHVRQAMTRDQLVEHADARLGPHRGPISERAVEVEPHRASHPPILPDQRTVSGLACSPDGLDGGCVGDPRGRGR